MTEKFANITESSTDQPEGEVVADTDGEAVSWRDSLDDDLRRSAERFNSPADILKSYGALRTKLSQSVTPPRADAGDEERSAFWRNLGRPDTPEGYSFAAPEKAERMGYDSKLEEWFRDTAFQMNLPADMAEGLYGSFVNMSGEFGERMEQERNRRQAESSASLQREWGADYKRNLEYANRAFSTVFGDDGEPARNTKLANGMEIGSDPTFIRAMTKMGRLLGEDELRGGSGTNTRTQSLNDELDTLTAKPDYWTNDGIQRRVRAIHVELYGTESIR